MQEFKKIEWTNSVFSNSRQTGTMPEVKTIRKNLDFDKYVVGVVLDSEGKFLNIDRLEIKKAFYEDSNKLINNFHDFSKYIEDEDEE